MEAAAMSEEELRSVLAQLHALSIQSARTTERIFGRLTTLDERQERFEANLDGVLATARDNGQQIAVLKQNCNHHRDETARQGRRVSDLVRKVNVAENTGAVHIATIRQTWRTVAIAAGAVVTLAGIVVGVLALLR